MSNSGVTSENRALLYVSMTSDLDAAVKPPGMVIQLSVQSDPTPGPASARLTARVTSAAVQVLVLIIKASVVSGFSIHSMPHVPASGLTQMA